MARKPKTFWGEPPAPIPELIRLPDGREIPTDEIINRARNRTSFNLRVRLKLELRAYTKYTLEDRRWISEQNYATLMERYNLTTQQARMLKYTSTKMLRQYKA